jgi:methylated-DNA-protein-cysteine methyltransferase-like protein
MSKLKLKSKSFFSQVYLLVRKIPKGKVVTYGQIAKVLGTKDSRRVGWALHANKDPQVSCHRVVNKQGGLAINFGLGGFREQARRLKAEGIKLKDKKVDLKKYQFDKLG